jgi:glycosyltransferase involved in cell wall biosynthesis
MSLSVVIPSRSDQYLQKTVDDLLRNAEGEIEVIVSLDGYWPNPILTDDKRVRVIHQGTFHNSYGMRAAINAGMAIAKGEYVMKCDEHTLWEKGFDLKLKADCLEHDVVVPRRYRLDPEKWEIINDGRNPVDHMYLTNPFMRPGDKTNGLRGQEWKERFEANKYILYDESMSTQGSAYFMRRAHWEEVIKDMDDVNYGPFTSEAQEIGLKTQLSGGRLMTNKKTFYAHWWKGKNGKNYGFSQAQYKQHGEETERGRLYSIRYWLTTKDYMHDFTWLMEKFWTVPTWPENWREFIPEQLENLQ